MIFDARLCEKVAAFFRMEFEENLFRMVRFCIPVFFAIRVCRDIVLSYIFVIAIKEKVEGIPINPSIPIDMDKNVYQYTERGKGGGTKE